MSYRGTFTTGPHGTYEVRTTRPTDYQIPTDGPVGRMLARSGRSAWRPAHVHFLVSCHGCRTLITHLFDAAYVGVDAVFGVRESLTIDMSTPNAHFDFTLDPLG